LYRLHSQQFIAPQDPKMKRDFKGNN